MARNPDQALTTADAGVINEGQAGQARITRTTAWDRPTNLVSLALTMLW